MRGAYHGGRLRKGSVPRVFGRLGRLSGGKAAEMAHGEAGDPGPTRLAPSLPPPPSLSHPPSSPALVRAEAARSLSSPARRRSPRARRPAMASKIEDMLQKELEQAKAGTHQRQKGEEKRLAALKQARIKKAEQLRQLRNDVVETQFESVRAEVRAPALLRASPPRAHPASTSAHSPLSRSVLVSSLARLRRSTIATRASCRIGCTRMWSSARGARPRPRT
jgi:hypothetical protein